MDEKVFYIPYDEIQVGNSVERYVLISDELVKSFSAIIGDTNSFHVRDESAAMTVFKRRIVHGVHLLAYISVLIGQELPGFGTIYCSHDFKFLAPVYIGEAISVKVEVLEKLSHSRIKLQTTIKNESTNKVVFDGVAVIKTYR